MSDIEPRDQFTSEAELRKLLERWEAPEPPRSLDRRITNSFTREIANANLQAESALLSQRQKEVVAMKSCSTCHEEFADKFSFCPVDGTPLNAVVARVEEPSITSVSDRSETIQAPIDRSETIQAPVDAKPEVPADPRPRAPEVKPIAMPVPTPALAGGGSGHLVPRGEYHLTMMDDAGLVTRLSHEVKDVAHEYELTWPEFKRDPFGFTKRT